MAQRERQALPLTARMKDGRIYLKSRTTAAGIIYLRCRNARICQGTAKIENGQIRDLNPHSEYCLADDRALLIAQFKEALKESLRNHWYKLKDLYDMMAEVYPDAASWVSYCSVKSYMKRCRQALFPPRPDTIEQFVCQIMDPQFERMLEYNTGRLSVKLFTDGNGDNHAVFYDDNFVKTEMVDVTRLFIDGTFRSTPDLTDAYQLGIPLVWVIMSRKTQIAYQAVFAAITEDLIPNENIKLVMSNFEAALRNAIRQVFAAAHSTGCNTHFDRALYQKAKSLGLQNFIRENADAKLIFKKLMP